MKQEILEGTIGTVLSATGTALQTNEILQTISLVITILGAVISMIIIPIITWWRNSKKDNKIDKEELKEGVEILKEGIENTIDVIKENNK